jgi:hypothetical protein
MICVKRQYTIAEDTLGTNDSFLVSYVLTFKIDPDDLIFPRVATRVGPKFQANVGNAPTAENTSAIGMIVIEDLTSGFSDSTSFGRCR